MKQIPGVKVPGARTLSAPEMNRMPFDTGKRSEVPSTKGVTSLKSLEA